MTMENVTPWQYGEMRLQSQAGGWGPNPARPQLSGSAVSDPKGQARRSAPLLRSSLATWGAGRVERRGRARALTSRAAPPFLRLQLGKG